jgi:putative oxidoreductase
LNRYLNSIFQNSWVELASRWVLGLTFIYSSYGKILSPADFAKIIYGYDLFPVALINLIAIILPFLQLVAGLALILGTYPRSAVLIVNALLLAFMILLSINLVRGHEFNCGCFALKNSGNNLSSETTLIRDFVYLALGLQVFIYNRSRRWCVPNFSALRNSKTWRG